MNVSPQWAFGVTVWELFTCGRVPFSGIPVTSVLKELKAGHRLEKPENTACYDEMLDENSICILASLLYIYLFHVKLTAMT